MIAVSRLMLDNIDHIKAYWVMLGKRLAQTALHFGANDFDGTITSGGELMESYLVEAEERQRGIARRDRPADRRGRLPRRRTGHPLPSAA
jgi:aminodeoxyfutalosine synthase